MSTAVASLADRDKASQVLLEVKGLGKSFYGVEALRDIDLEVRSGEIVGLIGPNGSGKTTLFNCVTGFLRPDRGRILLRGQDITGASPDVAARRGLARTHQLVQVYPGLTCRENLLIAVQEHQERSVWRRILRTWDVRRHEAQARQLALESLKAFDLSRQEEDLAGTLSYGQRKLLEFAGVIMADPALILLDEPAAAVNPTMIERMKGHIRRLNRSGKTFLIVEHNMDVVMDICTRVVVLDVGQVIANDRPAIIRTNPAVLQAYFGR